MRISVKKSSEQISPNHFTTHQRGMNKEENLKNKIGNLLIQSLILAHDKLIFLKTNFPIFF